MKPLFQAVKKMFYCHKKPRISVNSEVTCFILNIGTALVEIMGDILWHERKKPRGYICSA
jgi:hypothetical protein